MAPSPRHPGLPWGASEGAQRCSPSSYLPILPPSPTWQLSPPYPALPPVMRLSLSGGAKKRGWWWSWGAENTEWKGVNNKWESGKQEIKVIGKGKKKKERRRRRKKWSWSRVGLSGCSFLCNPPWLTPPPSPFAPTDRTHWPVFNKAPVLGRFLSSSINCSREVTQGRERAREIEREGGGKEGDGKNERDGGKGGKEGEIDLIKRWRKKWMRWRNTFRKKKIPRPCLYFSCHTPLTADSLNMKQPLHAGPQHSNMLWRSAEHHQGRRCCFCSSNMPGKGAFPLIYSPATCSAP